MIRISRRLHRPVALGFMDLDGFKGVNDTRGHAAGDGISAGVPA
ncbi:MAG: diguanylate cyclase [Gammaproteobacteria bacterium]